MSEPVSTAPTGSEVERGQETVSGKTQQTAERKYTESVVKTGPPKHPAALEKTSAYFEVPSNQ